ncbi:MAG: glycosyltransferase [Pseudomonadota bacterium]
MARPLLLLLAYQQDNFIEAAICGALNQDGPTIDILISDDASTDGTWEVIEQTVRNVATRHRVTLNRNARNLGLTGHLNACMSQTDAQHVIVAAGDDISAPNRVEAIMACFAETDAVFVHSDVDAILANGKRAAPQHLGKLRETSDILRLARSQGLYIGATGAWDRVLFDRYGPLPDGVYEDLILGFRAALEGRVGFVNAPLVQYRANVGMSTESCLHRTEADWRDDRMNTVERGLRTFQQRARDATTAGHSEQSKLMKTLRHKVREYEARADILCSKHSALKSVDHLRAWWSERKRAQRAAST